MLNFDTAAQELIDIGRSFYARGWVMGTGGNFSAVLAQDPFRLAITASGLHKGELRPDSFLVVDEVGKILAGDGKPSAETIVHLTVAKQREAKCVLHTHSIWSTILSEAYAKNSGLAIHGYEMLKGLSGVTTHEHEEWIPVIENTQDYRLLAVRMDEVFEQHKTIHGILLSGHGLYTWGRDIAEARRHIEIFEFLFEVRGHLYLSQRT
jgi:methylthioribulose-1-phosphate dehydratase